MSKLYLILKFKQFQSQNHLKVHFNNKIIKSPTKQILVWCKYTDHWSVNNIINTEMTDQWITLLIRLNGLTLVYQQGNNLSYTLISMEVMTVR